MEAGFKRVDSWLNIAQVLDSFEGALNITQLRFDTRETSEPFDFVFFREKDLLSLTGGPNDMIRFRISDTGDFYAGFSNPSPIRGSVIGSITRDTSDAQAQDIYVDFPALWSFIPTNGKIVMVGGYATASIQIRGSLGDPEFFGVAYGQSVRLRIPQFLEEDIRPVPMIVTIEGNEMTFGPLPATVGNGRGMVTGWFRIDRWIPNIFSIDIAVPQETPVPFKFDLKGVLAQGIAAGNMNVAMEDHILNITGDLAPEETEISLDAVELARAQQEDLFGDLIIPVVVDIGITTGKKVEFLWPTRDFPVLRTYADMGVRAQIAALPEAAGRWHLMDYCDTMGEAYAAADAVVARSGATTLAEIGALGKPGLLVPYPHAAADEQTANARNLVDAGAALMVADADLDGPAFTEKLERLITDGPLREAMHAACRAQGGAQARVDMARLVIGMVSDRSVR
jgi:hypothetical protein